MVTPFIETFTDWKTIVKDKHLLFDSCVLIDIIDFKAEDFLLKCKLLGCTPTYIHPVHIELMRTQRPSDRINVQRIFDEHEFIQLPMTQNIIKKTNELQEELHAANCHPEPEDLYLGATVAVHKFDQFLLTSNHSDFPEPVFTRKAQVIFQNNSKMKILNILSYKEVS